MKKLIITTLAVLAAALSLTACKSGNDEYYDNGTSAPYASQMPYDRVSANNGVVTDGNGIIGDDDDLIPAPERSTDNIAERIGDTAGNAARNIGDTVSDITSNAGNIVSNVTSNVGDTVNDIADNAGDTIENAADNADGTRENS